MIFNGDLSKYHPADAIMFLSQLNLNGVFSIAENQRVIAIGFNNGAIIDAHSKRGDAKVLQALIYRRRISPDQIGRIRRVQTETGMPIRAILAKLNYFPLSTVKDILLVGMNEVLLEMFLLNRGAFHFTDTPLDTDDAATRLDPRVVAIRITAQSDDFADFEKGIISLDRELSMPARIPTNPSGQSTDAEIILRLAANCRTVRQLIEKAPLDSYAAMQIVKEQLENGAIVLLPPAMAGHAPVADVHTDPLFGVFRQSLKKLMLTNDPLKQLEALVNYCKGFYDGMLILTAKDGMLIHCKQVIRRGAQGFTQKSRKGQLGGLNQDPMLSAVHRAQVGFLGEHFPSKLLDSLSGASPDGECALIPITTNGVMSLFLYVFSQKKFSGLSPQHYLELLSWMVTSQKKEANEPESDNAAQQADLSGTQPPLSGELNLARLVSAIDDLPPLPLLVTRALELLSDPAVAIKDIEAVIGKDQSLVSKLIRVSNSALYGGLNRVESLQQALTRLGAKTTKSLILAASMQGYFIKTNSGVQAWGQALWQHAAECGMAARRLAAAVGYHDPEKAFVGGVVHDIGKLVILMAGEDAYRQIQTIRRQEELSELEAERRILGTDHTAIGVQLMEKWKMPPSARLCVEYHHCFDKTDTDTQLAAIAACANHLGHLYGTQTQPISPECQTMAEKAFDCLEISAVKQDALVKSLVTDFQEASLL